MNLRQFQSVFRHYLDARVTVQLVSSPGLGKSETVENSVIEFSKADGEEWGLCTLMAAALTPPDVLGYLVPGKRKMAVAGPNGQTVYEEIPVSEFTMPPWMMSNDGRPMNSFKRGIIFLDEWDKVDPDTKRALAQVLLRGEAGNWHVHSGIGVVTAANRAQDRSGSTKEYDFIINRRAELHIVPDPDAWEQWATKNGVGPLYVAFAKRNTQIVFEGRVPDKQEPFCTPRSLVMLSRLLRGMENSIGMLPIEDERQHAMITEMTSGLIGPAAANHFMTWCKMKSEVPDFETIVKHPDTTEIPSKPDAKMLVAYDCAFRVTAETVAQVVDYCLRLPPDMQLVFGAAAIRRDHKLLASKPFISKFLPKNAGLIGLMTT